MNLPKDSIHLLSGYTNYAISKVTYRYAIKIDSDQLFFSESFKKYCDAYRTEQKVRINPLEQIAYIHLTCIILKRTKVQKENGKTG